MGMLDNLFASDSKYVDPATLKLGQQTEDDPVQYRRGYDDYTGDIPVRRPKSAAKSEDEDLQKFRETHPLTPQNATEAAPPMSPGAPIPGMLGGSLGGFPQAQPAPAAVPPPGAPQPLPPPQAIPPAPGDGGAPMGALDAGAPPPAVAAPAAPPRGPSNSPTEGAIDLRDADPSIVSKIWKGIQDNSGLLLGLGAGLAGAPSWAVGASRGFAGAAAGSQADQRQALVTQGGQQLYQALVAAGAPRQQAIAATTNPELAKRLMDQYMVDRKAEIKVLKDSLGNERIVATNPYMGQDEIDKINNQTAGGPGGAAGLGQLAQMPINVNPETGRDDTFAEAFKKADPVNYAATQDLLEGNMGGTGRNLQQLMKYAARIDPTFNQATFAARNNLYKSYYGGGEGFKQLRSANTTVDHGLKLDAAIDRLHNFTVLPDYLNPVTGKIKSQYSGAYQKAVSDFNAAADIYAHELENALTGKSTVSGYKELRGLFDKYASPETNHSALQSTIEKLGERVHEHEAAYNRGMGGKASKDPVKDFLTNQKQLEQLIGGDAPAAPAASTKPPPPGNYVYDPVKKKLVPAQ